MTSEQDYRIELRVDAKDKAQAIAWLRSKIDAIEKVTSDWSEAGGGNSGASFGVYAGPRPLTTLERIVRLEGLVKVAPLLLLLAGCAGPWEKAGATQTSLDADLLQCRYEAEKAVASSNDGVAAGWNQGQLTASCMKVRGWTR